ncbi:MAG: hypothetical protein KF900_04910 [Bacteroidetes bacterium]|nr:hypothetical protein [Bacteroidota bacterium]
MHTLNIPNDIKEQYKYAIEKAREDRDRYLNWIKNEIETAITLINKFDKIYVLGGLGSKLIKSTPTFYNQFLATYDGTDKAEIQDEELIQNDDEIEVLLEYAMNIATATPNTNKNIIPTQKDIEEIRQQLSKIKTNINFWELSAENPVGGNEFDHWLRTNIMQDTINVRGDGYHTHIQEIYQEVFTPFDGFLQQYYGFNSNDIFSTILKLDSLVYSKIGNPFGATQSHKRLTDWMDEVGQETITRVMVETGKHFIAQFTEANPDLYDSEAPENVMMHSLDRVESYNKIFWVIPKTDKEKLIFEKLSIEFGTNGVFYQPPKFKAFPLNDTLINLKPLIKEDDKYFHFSLNLAFRNIFKITEELIKSADTVYYENSFKGNSNANSRDNYIEQKTKQQFEKLLPTATFYHSLGYSVVENGQNKKTELDILGVSSDTIYIIEVKAGELNTKHRRGAIKGLKDRLEETINEGSYQCHRALKYIQENDNPSFDYVETGAKKTLTIDKAQVQSYFKISVTFEHFSSISANLKYLINSGVLSPDFKWTWIVSLYDLMIFADLIQSETEFKEYLTNRIALYDRNDIQFSDEIDILGFYFQNHFPLGQEKENEMMHIVNFKDEIETYYTRTGVGMPVTDKPKKKPK